MRGVQERDARFLSRFLYRRGVGGRGLVAESARAWPSCSPRSRAVLGPAACRWPSPAPRQPGSAAGGCVAVWLLETWVLEVELLLPQPAASAPPTSTTASNVNGFCIIDPLGLKGRSPAGLPAARQSSDLPMLPGGITRRKPAGDLATRPAPIQGRSSAAIRRPMMSDRAGKRLG